MNIFNPLKKVVENGNGKSDYYIALYLDLAKVSACLFKLVDQKGEVIASSHQELKEENEEEVLESVAKVIDEACAIQNFIPSKIIFGLPPSWLTSEEEIKEEYGELIKKIASDLELEPLAFVGIDRALGFLSLQEGKTNFILFGSFKDEQFLTVYQGGKLVFSKKVEIGENLGDDLFAALEEENIAVPYPSLFHLYGTGDLEEIKDKLVKFDWQSKKELLHLSRVEIAHQEDYAKAVSFAAAFDLGAKETVVEEEKSQEEFEKFEKEEGAPQDQVSPTVEKEEKIRDFGFVYGKDILTEGLPEKEEEKLEKKKFFSPTFLGDFISLILAILPTRGFKKIPLFFLFVLPLLIVVLLYYFVPNAQVTIFTQGEEFSRDTQVRVVPTSPNIELQEVLGENIAVSKVGSSKAVATGKKEIGEKAKGEVSISNWTQNEKKFAAQTKLSGPNNLKFVLEGEVAVAQRTSQAPGKATAKVIAQEIGPESNLPAGTDLTFDDFDELLYSAFSEAPFSGGEVKEVTVISKEDLRRLDESLNNDLREQAKQELTLQIGQGRRLLDEAIQFSFEDKKFDKKEGDEADILTLEKKVVAKAMVFSDLELKKVLKIAIEKQNISNFKASEGNINFEPKVARVGDDGSLALFVNFKAILLPDFDISRIKKELRFKDKESTQAYLSSLPQAKSNTISIRPSLPSILGRMPLREENIVVVVAQGG